MAMETAPEIRKRPRTADRVLALLQSRAVLRSAPELTETLGARRETVTTALQSLQQRGLVEKVGTGHATRYRAAGLAAVAASQPAVLVGNRPRLLGLRAAWLSEQERLSRPERDAAAAEPGPAEATA